MRWTQNIFKSVGILFGLVFLIALYACVMYQWVGRDFAPGRDYPTRNAFMKWHLVENLASFAAAVLLIVYYRFKGYLLSFLTAIIATTASVLLVLLVHLLLSLHQELENLYLPAMFAKSGTGVLASAALLFSKSGKRRWLKWAGIISGLAAMTVLFANFNFFCLARL